MKNYEVYSRNFSQVIQDHDIMCAIAQFNDDNPHEEVITVENIEARNESPSPLSGEEIKPYEEWETGENGKPQPPRWLQEKAMNIVSEQMEKYIAAGSLNNRFSIRGFGVDLLCVGYKMKNDSLQKLPNRITEP